jgi:hypothetical protein
MFVLNAIIFNRLTGIYPAEPKPTEQPDSDIQCCKPCRVGGFETRLHAIITGLRRGLIAKTHMVGIFS